MSQRVFLVFENILYSESCFRGVFSTCDKATDYAEYLQMECGGSHTSFTVEIATLDERK